MPHAPTILLVALAALSARTAGGEDATKPPEPRFVRPCDAYETGLEKGRGNFGLYVTDDGSPFASSWHLAEDVWLPAGTEVRAIADGVVRYSSFSPTWTDAKGGVHWNLGNVIVIEHPLSPPVEGLASICSVYVHLASDRRVAVGDEVARRRVIGRIGAHRSEENGRYPAHLHFGIHRGPYFQITPTEERNLRNAAASKTGLVLGDRVLRGELRLELHRESSVLITAVDSGEKAVLSLLVGSTAPKDPPPDIAGWCEGYGAKETLAEWIEPSGWFARNAARVTGTPRR